MWRRPLPAMSDHTAVTAVTAVTFSRRLCSTHPQIVISHSVWLIAGSVLKMKLATLSLTPAPVLSEASKLEAVSRDRERANRVLIEFGSQPSQPAASETVAGEGSSDRLRLFLRLVRAPDGSPVHRGALSTLSTPALAAPIDRVVLSIDGLHAESVPSLRRSRGTSVRARASTVANDVIWVAI